MNLLEKTRQLLWTYKIAPNRFLGQNFLVDETIFPKLSEYASLGQTDAALDVGAGFGFLSCFMANKCAHVLAVEKDARVASVLRKQVSGSTNICVIEGDVLAADVPVFDKVVSAPPYQISSELLNWLFLRPFKCAVLILQEEFASRITASTGTDDYSWMTVYAYYHTSVESLDAVPRQKFYPEPEVDSTVVRLIPRSKPAFPLTDVRLFKQMLKSVFAERNKKLINAAMPFAKNVLGLSSGNAKSRLSKLPFFEDRVRTLAPEAFGDLARVLIR